MLTVEDVERSVCRTARRGIVDEPTAMGVKPTSHPPATAATSKLTSPLVDTRTEAVVRVPKRSSKGRVRVDAHGGALHVLKTLIDDGLLAMGTNCFVGPLNAYTAPPSTWGATAASTTKTRYRHSTPSSILASVFVYVWVWQRDTQSGGLWCDSFLMCTNI